MRLFPFVEHTFLHMLSSDLIFIMCMYVCMKEYGMHRWGAHHLLDKINAKA